MRFSLSLRSVLTSFAFSPHTFHYHLFHQSSRYQHCFRDTPAVTPIFSLAMEFTNTNSTDTIGNLAAMAVGASSGNGSGDDAEASSVSDSDSLPESSDDEGNGHSSNFSHKSTDEDANSSEDNSDTTKDSSNANKIYQQAENQDYLPGTFEGPEKTMEIIFRKGVGRESEGLRCLKRRQ